MTALPIGDAVALLYLYPILTIFVARCYLGEAVQEIQVLSALTSALGALLIWRPTFLFPVQAVANTATINPLGYVTVALGSCYASGVVVFKISKAGTSTVGAHTLQLLFSWCQFGL